MGSVEKPNKLKQDGEDMSEESQREDEEATPVRSQRKKYENNRKKQRK